MTMTEDLKVQLREEIINVIDKGNNRDDIVDWIHTKTEEYGGNKELKNFSGDEINEEITKMVNEGILAEAHSLSSSFGPEVVVVEFMPNTALRMNEEKDELNRLNLA